MFGVVYFIDILWKYLPMKHFEIFTSHLTSFYNADVNVRWDVQLLGDVLGKEVRE